MIGIIAAMEQEISLLQKNMEEAEIQDIGNFKFYTGKINGKNAVLLQCGIGKVAAAVGCALMIQKFKPDCIINTGSAGGIKSGLKPGDVVISSGLIYHDVDVTAFGYAPGQLPAQPQIFKADEKLVKLAEDTIDELKKTDSLPGDTNHCREIIGSGDIFMCDPARIAEMSRVFPDIAAVEMEGAAIAHCCNLFSVPFLVIRALSDVAGTESPVSFDEFLPVASRHSAQIVMKIISDYC